MVAPWIPFSASEGEDQDGWPNDVLGPSDIPHGPRYNKSHALMKEGIQHLKQGFVDAAKRVVRAGFDVVEIHSAYGYMLHEFISPVANKRTEEYGGSFENRIRLHLEIINAVRAVIPQDMSLFMRYVPFVLLQTAHRC